jgi:hypothetical protein
MTATDMTDHEKVGHYVEMWKQTVQVQQHFNDIEWRIRGLALTVLTFALGAAAVAARDGANFGRVSLGTMVLMTSLLLWYSFYFVDKYWYHPLLKASVDHGETLETAINQFLPTEGLTKAISKGSGYIPRPLFGMIRIHKGEMHSVDKLNRFYGLGAVALVVLAAALQVAVLTVPAAKVQPPAHSPAQSTTPAPTQGATR